MSPWNILTTNHLCYQNLGSNFQLCDLISCLLSGHRYFDTKISKNFVKKKKKRQIGRVPLRESEWNIRSFVPSFSNVGEDSYTKNTVRLPPKAFNAKVQPDSHEFHFATLLSLQKSPFFKSLGKFTSIYSTSRHKLKSTMPTFA